MTALPTPSARRLRVYAFDPNASLDLGSSKFSHATISLPWQNPGEDALRPGPTNDYLEVIDIDPPSNQFYEPIDLDAPEVLAQDGLAPSEGDPRFHQQMVFAVAMKTIRLFERALGRKILWAPVWDDTLKTYVPTMKLRVYPHALREANAYYSREKRALLFGYFNASHRRAGATWIFTALSHDIIVHETTHAILDGLHPRYAESTSADSLAFHEAFADIAALFSHFQLTEAVYSHIERHGADLDRKSLLSGLASQFAKGTSDRTALRDFVEKDPNPDQLMSAAEPHDRGAILVAAVFDAFHSIYRARTEPLRRISGPAGVARPHPDLVALLTAEAAKSADHVLRMCIRALDYLPPVDVRFGEFLRAIITADADLIPDDRLNYRLAFVEAFRARGIYADDCLSMSPDNLMWTAASQDPLTEQLEVNDLRPDELNLTPDYRREVIVRNGEANRRAIWYWLTQQAFDYASQQPGTGKSDDQKRLDAFLGRARKELASNPDERPDVDAIIKTLGPDLAWCGIAGDAVDRFCQEATRTEIHFVRWLHFLKLIASGTNVRTNDNKDQAWERALGIYFKRTDGLGTIHGTPAAPNVEVSSVRTTRRAGPDGQDIRQLVIEVTQRRHGFYEEAEQDRLDAQPEFIAREGTDEQRNRPGDFLFRGGATIIIDLRDYTLRYVISKRIDDAERLKRQREHLLNPTSSLAFTYTRARSAEPFALLHRH